MYDRKAGYPWGTSGLFPDIWDSTYFNSDTCRDKSDGGVFQVRASCSMMATCR